MRKSGFNEWMGRAEREGKEDILCKRAFNKESRRWKEWKRIRRGRYSLVASPSLLPLSLSSSHQPFVIRLPFCELFHFVLINMKSLLRSNGLYKNKGTESTWLTTFFFPFIKNMFRFSTLYGTGLTTDLPFIPDFSSSTFFPSSGVLLERDYFLIKGPNQTKAVLSWKEYIECDVSLMLLLSILTSFIEYYYCCIQCKKTWLRVTHRYPHLLFNWLNPSLPFYFIFSISRVPHTLFALSKIFFLLSEIRHF